MLAPQGPTFVAIKCKSTGQLRRSTVDLVVNRDEVENLRRIDSYAALSSDHYPVAFNIQLAITRIHKPLIITKTLLLVLAEAANLHYEKALGTVDRILNEAGDEPNRTREEKICD